MWSPSLVRGQVWFLTWYCRIAVDSHSSTHGRLAGWGEKERLWKRLKKCKMRKNRTFSSPFKHLDYHLPWLMVPWPRCEEGGSTRRRPGFDSGKWKFSKFSHAKALRRRVDCAHFIAILCRVCVYRGLVHVHGNFGVIEGRPCGQICVPWRLWWFVYFVVTMAMWRVFEPDQHPFAALTDM